MNEGVSKAHFSLFAPIPIVIVTPKGYLLICRHLGNPLQGVGGNITSF